MKKTETMKVDSHAGGMLEALAMTEQLGADAGLAPKQNLHLRLLAEELFGMLRSIAGDVEADYWLEHEDRHFEMHMQSDVKLTEEMRQQLLSASSSGENAAARGIMGKIRVMIAEILYKDVGGPSLLSGLSLGMLGMASPTAQNAGAGTYHWSMEQYMDEVKKQKDKNAAASEAWDELEKSIVANIADDISVSIIGSEVAITVSKTF